ncbi:MAG: hypothetical protein ACRCZB_07515 [Bacteroidales bacterium]
MDKLNFLEKPDFPLSSTWLDKQYQITRQLADSIASMVMSNPTFAGKRAVIYSGCEVNSTQISSGYIVFDGVLYQFRSGEIAQYLVLKRKHQIVTVGVEEYTPYEEYWVEMSSGSTGSDVISAIAWNEVLRYNRLINSKFDKANVAQGLGTSEDMVVSQAYLNGVIGWETAWQSVPIVSESDTIDPTSTIYAKRDATGGVHLKLNLRRKFSPQYEPIAYLPFRPDQDSLALIVVRYSYEAMPSTVACLSIDYRHSDNRSALNEDGGLPDNDWYRGYAYYKSKLT